VRFILKRCNSLHIDRILAEFVLAGGETLYSEIHKLISFICNKEELPQQWKESVIVPVYKKSVKSDYSNC
jgi:hypothetical protein